MAGKSVPKVKQKLDKKDLTLSLAFLLPAILITVIFVIYPVFDTVGLSFRKWNGMFGAAKQWVGLENYQKIFSDKLFWNAMLNSVYFMDRWFRYPDAAFIWSRNAGNCKDQGNRILQNLLLPSEYVRNNSSSPDVDIYVKSELWYL